MKKSVLCTADGFDRSSSTTELESLVFPSAMTRGFTQVDMLVVKHLEYIGIFYSEFANDTSIRTAGKILLNDKHTLPLGKRHVHRAIIKTLQQASCHQYNNDVQIYCREHLLCYFADKNNALQLLFTNTLTLMCVTFRYRCIVIFFVRPCLGIENRSFASITRLRRPIYGTEFILLKVLEKKNQSLCRYV